MSGSLRVSLPGLTGQPRRFCKAGDAIRGELTAAQAPCGETDVDNYSTFIACGGGPGFALAEATGGRPSRLQAAEPQVLRMPVPRLESPPIAGK
jgi:hypothetical protein